MTTPYQLGSMDWLNPQYADPGMQNFAQMQANPNVQFDSSSLFNFGQPNATPEIAFDWNNLFGNFAKGAQGVAGLASIWAALKGLKENKRMNNFSMNFANAQLADNRQAYNTETLNRAEGMQTRADRTGGSFDMSGWLAPRLLEDQPVRT